MPSVYIIGLSRQDRQRLEALVARSENWREGGTGVRGLGSGLASCHWEAALIAREASQRKQAGKWQDLTPATQTIHRAGVAQQSGLRASPVQGPVRRRGLASIRNATSTALRAASHLAPAQGFHARGRCLEIMTG